ncbi:hypothetical protein Pfo_022351 [Paulownia fortunei]|nr:hypothetical protein Pfo_022351 [Paulownia fortunei]
MFFSWITFILVVWQDGDKVYYQVRRDKKIQNLLFTYCKGKNLEYNEVAFLHNSQRIIGTKTPDELDLENEDQIDALFHQTGGGYSAIHMWENICGLEK